jgi:membrane protein DedA with SNARE-associated domain/rhodanese-related sulfurtransferase
MDATLQFLLRHGYAVLFLWVLAEQAGLPAPSMPMLLAAGALAAAGHLSLPLVLSFAVMACLISDSSWFAVGRVKGFRVLNWMCRISLEPDSCVSRTKDIYTRHGSRSLLVAKFVPGFSTLSPPLAGIFRMPAWQFLIYDGAGSFLWAGAFVLLGYLLSNQLEIVAHLALRLGTALLFLLGTALAAYVAMKYSQRRRVLRDLRVARISPQELKRLMDLGEQPLVIDLRPSLDFEVAPEIIPGAVHLDPDDIEVNVANIPHDREVVLYCSCPNELSSARAALLLKRYGISRVRPLEGGFEAWQDLGYPIAIFNPRIAVVE